MTDILGPALPGGLAISPNVTTVPNQPETASDQFSNTTHREYNMTSPCVYPHLHQQDEDRQASSMTRGGPNQPHYGGREASRAHELSPTARLHDKVEHTFSMTTNHAKQLSLDEWYSTCENTNSDSSAQSTAIIPQLSEVAAKALV